jgi:hypothetical protein
MFAIASGLAFSLVGCASHQGESSFAVPAGEFPRAFDAARRVLGEHRFSLERVDAQAGIITTAPQATAGFIAPWENVQTSAAQELEDFFHKQSRKVRIDFITSETGSVRGQVVASVVRTQTPGMRPQSVVIGMTTQTLDPALLERSMAGSFDVVTTRDDALGAKLAREIERSLSRRE